ncbi:proteinaceous RNase P 1, chloroplastic/mitochondrial isoform X2 [Macadamia integrifolia]|uniref:proteinaceous RNase P 1, chloroplastic/mitochondrial isoform X2 n=1 Tax=Macadamia integrifolia TaxID=60698 RepID=UPI001C4FE1E6|nr:proteinaceous RNase P 1, chloroplastic/mitochondrial isoform X2 [Macadamia integrifolia]
MLFASSITVTPSLTRNHSLFTFFTKIPLLLFGHGSHVHRHLIHYPSLKPLNRDSNSFFVNKSIRHCSTAVCAIAPTHESSTTTKAAVSNKSKRKAFRESPEGVLRHKLDMCSKHGDLAEALRLYDDARSKAIPLNQHIYNVLLYLCSSSSQSKVESKSGGNDDERSNLGLRRGLEIFQQMGIDKIAPNEATFTSVARLAAAVEDPDMAFDMVKRMMSCHIPPRLRSYGPALFGFCEKREADKAYEVDAHMASSGVSPEEPELAALLGLSADVARGDRVYEMLHRLRTTVRQVSELTAETVERWFNSDAAADVGKEKWNVNNVKEGIAKGGGGWHGQGWLGKGKWKVERTEMDKTGVCRTCGEKLVSIDIDPLETQNFATSLSSLACKKEVKADFNGFQEWLRRHGPYDAVIDGANVGLINQHDFSFFQLNSIVNEMREVSPSKRLPLIILHHRRVNGGSAENPRNKKLIQSWKKSGALYATPAGSNDDWYWLYAAVSCKCLLVTNDEMRDHLFQLLGTSFFPRWKEKHQVRLTVSRRGPTLHMPPPYSIVIQESERGSWHVPTVTGDDIETPRKWVCATRAPPSDALSSQ